MEPKLFSLIFIAAVLLQAATRLWLLRRQRRHVSEHRARVPEAFVGRIDLFAHQRAADYTLVRTRFAMFSTVFGALVLLGWTLGGGLDLLDRAWQASGLSALLTGTGVLLSMLFISSLIELPLDVYRTFVIEQRFGFNRTTPALFISDLIKNTLLTLAIGTPLVWLVLWLMLHAGTQWWLWVWLVWMGFSLFMIWAYPAFIAPLFNRFKPLDDAALHGRIENLLTRCGFTSRGVFVMDGSRRSSHGNAYFTGFGNNKRIVFFDTLLQALEPVEVEAVLAHELGHFRRRHVLKLMLLMSIGSLLGLALLGWLATQPWFYLGLGVTVPSQHMALLLFLLSAPVFTFFLQPLLAAAQRRHEFEADDFAAEQTDAAILVHALVKLYRDNASTLTPDPLYSAFHDSHPPAPVRVAHLLAKLHPSTP